MSPQERNKTTIRLETNKGGYESTREEEGVGDGGAANR